jgi:hypothetical protein
VLKSSENQQGRERVASRCREQRAMAHVLNFVRCRVLIVGGLLTIEDVSLCVRGNHPANNLK